ncbi:tensin-4-like [Leucoraja erinacea]|uniref:tensin-4-like n=1 Tax=Leucoraja erinaceus TaxID=7782 RepID=UPI00245564A4|nr:tensin-4-like [Leucoraja erinacea]
MMQGTLNHGPHLDSGQAGCLHTRMETIVLNGAAVSHGHARAVCPGRGPDSRGDSFEPSVRWTCREISVSPAPGCQTQEGSLSGLGRSQTFMARPVGSQKPPIHDGVRRVNSTRVTAHQERAKVSEYSGRHSPPFNTNCPDSEPLSPSLDATLENLNNLILELDPTFQPINTCPSRGRLTSGLQGSAGRRLAARHTYSGHSLPRPGLAQPNPAQPGILIYDEWDSRSSDHDSTSLSLTCESDSPGLRHQSTAVPVYRMVGPRIASSRLVPPRPASTRLDPPRPASSRLDPPRPASTHLVPPRPASTRLVPPRPASSRLDPPRPASGTARSPVLPGASFNVTQPSPDVLLSLLTAVFSPQPETTPHHVLDAGKTNCSSLAYSSYSPAASSTPHFRPLSPDSWIAANQVDSPPCVTQRQRQASDCLGPNSSSPQRSSQPIAVPPASSSPSSITSSMPHQQSHMPVNMTINGPGEQSGSYLSTSTDSGYLLTPAHGQRRRLGDSAPSLSSPHLPAHAVPPNMGPGIFSPVFSSQSLLSDEGEAGRFYRAAGSTFGSSGSFVNLRSPYIVSPSPASEQQQHGKAASFRTLPLPRRQAASGSAGGDPAAAPHGQSTHGLKKQANSCPASAAGSCTDIPLLLLNGCSQFPAHDARGPQSQRLPSISASTSSLPRSDCPTREFSKAASTSDIPRDVEPTVKFVQDTTKYWYKPHVSRDQAIEILKDKEPGSFLIRESSTYIGSFGLAMKLASNPDSPEIKTGDSSGESVRHFLIEFSPRGVCLKGCPQEPYFGSLSALVYQHCITALSLPRALRLPRKESPKDRSEGRSADAAGDNASPQRKAGAGCPVLYLNSVTMESLTGPQAVLKATSCILEQQPLTHPIRVQFQVSEQGIILTDSKRKLFFRRHYQAGSINHCGLDPMQRRWRKDNEPSRIFAFVAKKQGGSSENVCHVFAELERENSAHLIIGLVTSRLLEPQRR